VAGRVDVGALRSAGWLLRGQLSTMPYDDPLDAAPYASAAELVADPRVDAVAVDGDDPSLAALLPELRAGGLLLLLPTAAPLDPELVRAARAVPDAADACVGLVRRWEPWARTVRAALPLAGGPPVQVTVRGWPRGKQAAAELVDLVASWCGDVVGVVAAPAELPADALPGGAPVSWALLTGSGATALVSHEGGPELVRISFATARLEASPALVRWEGGDRLPVALPEQSGLVSTAAALAEAVGGRDVPVRAWPSLTPRPADLGDLLVVARVLEALRTSARTEQLARVG
jgi:predicted dehydrogenase